MLLIAKVWGAKGKAPTGNALAGAVRSAIAVVVAVPRAEGGASAPLHRDAVVGGLLYVVVVVVHAYVVEPRLDAGPQDLGGVGASPPGIGIGEGVEVQGRW
jgi:hypothetical protein